MVATVRNVFVSFVETLRADFITGSRRVKHAKPFLRGQFKVSLVHN